MERWHLTLLLTTGAVAGLALAPPLPLWSSPAEPPALVIPEVVTEPTASGPLTLSLTMDRAALLAGSGEARHVVVTVTAPDSASERVPVDVALVIDVSGSMGQGGKIDHARAAAEELVDALVPGDRFALVAFDDKARVLSEGAIYEGDPTRLKTLIRELRDDGGTNMYAGTQLGLAELDLGRAASKVVLISDGNANVGETEMSAFTALAHGATRNGATVSTIGLGQDFNEQVLEAMADAGGGAYHFVGHAGELPSVIADELARTSELVARRASVHIEVPEGVVIEEVYGWSADTDRNGADVIIGDLSAGQSTKIVLRVRCPDEALGSFEAARATLRYADVQGRSHVADASVQARVTDSASAVYTSQDKDASVATARASAGVLTRASADAWRRGDDEDAQRIVASARSVIAEAREATDAEELDEDAARMSTLQQLGSTEGTTYAAKAASEASRGLSR